MNQYEQKCADDSQDGWCEGTCGKKEIWDCSDHNMCKTCHFKHEDKLYELNGDEWESDEEDKEPYCFKNSTKDTIETDNCFCSVGGCVMPIQFDVESLCENCGNDVIWYSSNKNMCETCDMISEDEELNNEDKEKQLKDEMRCGDCGIEAGKHIGGVCYGYGMVDEGECYCKNVMGDEE